MDTRFVLDPSETALLVVDMQNGFCDPQGTLARSGRNYLPQYEIVPRVKELVHLCRAAGIHTVWSIQKHFPDDMARKRHKIPSHLDKQGSLPCLADTWDAELVDVLKSEVRPQDDVLEKHRSSCFYNTTLEVKLRMRGITTLIVCGVSTNYCVESTIRDAYARDYDIVMVEDCTACPWEDLQKATVKNVEIFYGMAVRLAALKDILPG
ncbi:MAG: cysteine hydrolase [Chloroflexi bacterium]|nr:cysteine hydrolase [Chloroflexota bacterium]